MMFHVSIVLALVFGFVGCRRLTQSSPPIEVSALQMATDYEENLPEAEAKYNDKSLVISGTVSFFTQIEGITVIDLEKINPDSKWQIVCFIDPSTQPDAYSRLKIGQNSIFTGTGEHQKNSFNIHIEDCKIK